MRVAARERWRGDPTRVTLVGHSAGPHLVALLSADPARTEAHAPGAKENYTAAVNGFIAAQGG